MIVKMKKVTLILLDSEREAALISIRKAGVVHLEDYQGNGEEYQKLVSINDNITETIALLEEVKIPKKASLRSLEKKPLEVVEYLLSLKSRKKGLEEEKINLKKDLSFLEPYGNFDPASLKEIRGSGYGISVCRLTEEQILAIDEDISIINIEQGKEDSLVLLFSKNRETFPYEEISFPEMGKAAILYRLSEIQEELNLIHSEFVNGTQDIENIKKLRQDLSFDLEFESVRSGLDTREELNIVNGYIPEPRLNELKDLSAINGWGLVSEDPEEEDPVPTQLKTNKISGLLKPILDILGIIPGYREFDVSFYFLVFFSIFTAMLIGDAGYGLLFLGAAVAGTIVSLRKSGKVPTILVLLYLLSLTTIIWGAVTGTWFASKYIINIGFFKQFKLAYFTGTETQVNEAVMFIAFLLGVTQLSLACIQGFIREFPRLKSFARLGWMAVLISIYFFILSQVLGRTFPPAMIYVLGSGVALIFVFGQQEKGQNFFIGLLKGLFANFLQTFLDIVGSFANIMSYIRLFAVGLASVKIAETFNSMASGMDEGAAVIGAVIILILGHGLNIILGLLAVFVHAIRLNVLEYSSQIGMEWSGIKYNPFSEQNSD